MSTTDSSALLTLADTAVAAAKDAGADDVFAHVSRTRKVEVSVREGKLEKVSDATSQGLTLEVWADGRYSTSRTTDLRTDQLARFSREAVELTAHLQPDPHRGIPDPALYADRADAELDLVDPAVLALDTADREALCMEQNALLAGQDKVISATSGTSDGHSITVRASSNGFSGEHQDTWLWMGSEVTLDDDGKRPEAWMWGGGPHRKQAPSPARVAELALARARARLGTTKGPTLKGKMVVDPSCASRLVGRLLGPADGQSVQQGRSFWADRLGKQVLSEKLTIIDDPLLPRGHRSRLFDGEGISARKRTLVSRGTLEQIYLDTYYARKLGQPATGGSASNRVVMPGRRPLAQILADVPRAVYVTSWLGGNADGTTGDFSMGLRGHVVENGVIGPPVGEMNVTGNLVQLFAQLIEVGNDPWPYDSLRTPTLVFDGVEFSGV